MCVFVFGILKCNLAYVISNQKLLWNPKGSHVKFCFHGEVSKMGSIYRKWQEDVFLLVGLNWAEE